MTIDAAGNVHSGQTGRFTGHVQGEGEPSVLAAAAVSQCSFCDRPARGFSTTPDGTSILSCGQSDHGFAGARFDYDPGSDPIDDQLRRELTEWLSFRNWLGETDQGDRDSEAYAENWDTSKEHAHDIVLQLAQKLGLPIHTITRCEECGGSIESGQTHCFECDPTDGEGLHDDADVEADLDVQMARTEAVRSLLGAMRQECGVEPRGAALEELGPKVIMFKGNFDHQGSPLTPGSSYEQGHVKVRTEDGLQFVPFSRLHWWRVNGDLPFEGEEA